MRHRLTLTTLAAMTMLAATGCGDLHKHDQAAGTTDVPVKYSQHLMRNQLSNAWPLTADAATLACHADNAVTVEVHRRRCALNNIATEDGFASINPIANGDTSTGVLLSRGLGLCSTNTP